MTMFGLQVLVSLFLCTPTVSPTQHARPFINTNILAIVKQICLVRYYDQCKECVLCKGYRPEARSYVIYSPRALRPRGRYLISTVTSIQQKVDCIKALTVFAVVV